MDWRLEFDAETGRHLFQGELGVYTVHEVQKAWMSVLETAGALCIDLAGVTEIDTAGLQLMLLAKRQAGDSMRFCNAAGAVQDVVRLVNLHSLLEPDHAAFPGSHEG
ncbi:STAS domain-containing protein [Chromobacterium alticapitis]|uniref:STAS domain-containing protein n=1 Tax=Chromobacterium alticapitis TaxID=2073169 RepID=A0A2S5DGP5_9NEIS|nr:STAS domain-containing protein [Chromobacterium alticapitis]POZ62266.1 hypothetical protein C2I19_08845 [Chromobacterium alticapitis]